MSEIQTAKIQTLYAKIGMEGGSEFRQFQFQTSGLLELPLNCLKSELATPTLLQYLFKPVGTGLEMVLCLTNRNILFGYQTCPKSELFDNPTKPVLSKIRTFRFRTITELFFLPKSENNHLSIPDDPVVQVILTESTLIAVPSSAVDGKILIDPFFRNDDST